MILHGILCPTISAPGARCSRNREDAGRLQAALPVVVAVQKVIRPGGDMRI